MSVRHFVAHFILVYFGILPRCGTGHLVIQNLETSGTIRLDEDENRRS